MKYNKIYHIIVGILVSTSINAQTQNFIPCKYIKSQAAKQAVAIDDKHVYAIDNQRIAKYTLNGDSISQWKETESTAMHHLNSGIVLGNKLYCAHSNYPHIPMTSSIEIFDTQTMKHIDNISFGINYGSCTWIAPGENCWFVFFAHYENKSQEPGKNVSWSQLVKFTKDWNFQEAWVLPEELLERIRPYSLSGGVLINDSFYCTGHDAKECYVLKLPQKGSVLIWETTYTIPFAGQGIAIDKEGNLWGIDRKERTIIKSCLPK